MKRLDFDTNEAFAFVGFVALVVGVALVFLPAALIVAGALLILYAILPDRGGPPA